MHHITRDGLLFYTHLLSVVELVGPVVVALFVLLERLADDVDLLLVLRGGDGRSHNGEQDDLRTCSQCQRDVPHLENGLFTTRPKPCS